MLKKIRLRLLSLYIFFAIVSSISLHSAESKGQDSFMLFDGKEVAQIYVGDNEPKSLKRAVGDLQKDIESVTGVRPELVSSIDKIEGNSIIIGTIIDEKIAKLIKENNINNANLTNGLKEAFLIKTFNKTNSGKGKSLLVLGSDALGAIYGTYEISERIGVHPLYWWCDIPIKRQKSVVLNNVLTLPKQPSIKFRGIFINDDEALIQWSRLTSAEKKHGHISPSDYKRIFELILRTRGNTIWPSMLRAGTYFFKFRDENGVAVNPKNATDYGLYIGTSHCENMGRNNYGEWLDWAAENKDKYDAVAEPELDYSVNPKAIEAYWQERLDECKNFNMIFTLGIRGIQDTPFFARKFKDQSLKGEASFLQKVIDRQREMIKNTFGSEDAVPQIFVPYEETGELYNGERKDGLEKCDPVKIPDDVMIVYTEDNYGYARQYSNQKERARSGGLGIYSSNDYSNSKK